MLRLLWSTLTLPLRAVRWLLLLPLRLLRALLLPMVLVILLLPQAQPLRHMAWAALDVAENAAMRRFIPALQDLRDNSTAWPEVQWAVDRTIDALLAIEDRQESEIIRRYLELSRS